MAGDVGQDNLGLSPGDKKLLTEKVNVIFHLAATLDFGDTLKTTVDINLLGTRRIIELAKQCSDLNALVHVSSAYVNSWRSQAEEVRDKASLKTFLINERFFFFFLGNLSFEAGSGRSHRIGEQTHTRGTRRKNAQDPGRPSQHLHHHQTLGGTGGTKSGKPVPLHYRKAQHE